LSVEVIVGDCREALKAMPDESVHCVVTSPPYFGLRDYGVDGQIGLEPTPDEFVAAMVDVFREVRRVLRKDGTCWLNLGDSYGNGKQLLGIPWRVALALQADGWVLRSEVVWVKGNHKPERVSDRPTNCHEKLFLLTRSRNYFYNAAAVAVPSSAAKGRPQRLRAEELAREGGLTDAHIRAIRSAGITDVGKGRATQTGTDRNTAEVQALAKEAKDVLRGYYREFLIGDTVNIRNVWSIDRGQYPGVHAAVFPKELVIPCIKAGCPDDGLVLDPFLGSGTTAITAAEMGRACIGIEINPEYAALARRRLTADAGLFAEVS